MLAFPALSNMPDVRFQCVVKHRLKTNIVRNGTFVVEKMPRDRGKSIAHIETQIGQHHIVSLPNRVIRRFSDVQPPYLRHDNEAVRNVSYAHSKKCG